MKHRSLLLLSVVALVALAGCGGVSEAPGPESPGTPAATPDAPVTETPTQTLSNKSPTRTPGGQSQTATPPVTDSTARVSPSPTLPPMQTPTQTVPTPQTATSTVTPGAPGTATQSAPTTATPTPSSDAETVTVTVTDVVDGDTIDIRFDNGSTDTVRLLGVDTPEVHTSVSPGEFEGVPDKERGRACLRDWGDRASQYAQDRLGGGSVTLHFDDQADRRGSFGRLLAYVTVDGENFNYDLVDQGYARVYDSTFSQSDRFYDAESAAQQAERNVWSCRSATPTPTSTDTTGTDLVVANVHEDAAGNDHENLNDEYVVLENTGETAIDMRGWSVKDEAGHTYNFPDQFTLDPGGEVRLHTGSGDDTDTDLYWGSERAVWNNGGDTVFVFDDTGAQVLSHQYG